MFRASRTRFACLLILALFASPVTLWAQGAPGNDGGFGLPTFELDASMLVGWLLDLWQGDTETSAEAPAPAAATTESGDDGGGDGGGLPNIGAAAVPIG